MILPLPYVIMGTNPGTVPMSAVRVTRKTGSASWVFSGMYWSSVTSNAFLISSPVFSMVSGLSGISSLFLSSFCRFFRLFSSGFSRCWLCLRPFNASGSAFSYFYISLIIISTFICLLPSCPFLLWLSAHCQSRVPFYFLWLFFSLNPSSPCRHCPYCSSSLLFFYYYWRLSTSFPRYPLPTLRLRSFQPPPVSYLPLLAQHRAAYQYLYM